MKHLLKCRIVLFTLASLTLLASAMYAQIALLPAVTCGCDQSGVNSYAFNPVTGALTATTGGLASSLNGFRSLVVHPTGHFAYANQLGSNSGVAGFAIIGITGALTPIVGSPFAGPAGGGSGAALVIDPAGKFLYFENIFETDLATFTVTISGYSINANTGALTPVAGSPVTLPTIQLTSPSLSVDPTGHFLYVVETNAGGYDGSPGAILGYTINSTTGTLLPMAGSPFPAGYQTNAIAIPPSGKFAYATNAGDNTVSAYTLNPVTGALSPAAGSPFAIGTAPNGLTIDPSSRFAYVSYSNETISGFSINPSTGAFTLIPGSQITGQMFSIDPSGSFAYASSGSVMLGYSISPTTGALSQITTTTFAGAARGPLAFVPISAISLVQSVGTVGLNVPSLGAVFPSPPTAGNLIIAYLRKSSPSETVAISDSLGNTYVQAVTQIDAVDNFQTFIFYATNIQGGSADAVTAKFSNFNNHPFLAIYEFAGLGTTNPLDRISSALGTYTAVASSGQTGATTNATELFFSGAGFSSGSTGKVTPDSGYTLLQTSALGANEFKVVNAIGSADPKFNLSVPTDWTAVTATFSAAPYTPPLGIFTMALTNAMGGTAYNFSLVATGGTSPYSWSIISGALPTGLSLDASTGIISGTPSTTAAATNNFTVQVTDSTGKSASRTLTLTVNVVSLVQSVQVSGSSVNQLQAALPFAFTPGDLIVVFIRSSGTSTPAVIDNLGLSYISAVSQTQKTNHHSTNIYYLAPSNPNVTTLTAMFDANNDHPFMAIYEFSGVTSLDQTASSQGANSTVSVQTSAVTSSPTELVFVGSGYQYEWAGTVTPSSGYAILEQDGAAGSATEFSVMHTESAATAGFGLSKVADWSAVMATFK